VVAPKRQIGDLDELGEVDALPTRARRFREKGLQVLADDAAEDAALGRARFVRGGHSRHISAYPESRVGGIPRM